MPLCVMHRCITQSGITHDLTTQRAVRPVSHAHNRPI
jgi:hypothetical protein